MEPQSYRDYALALADNGEAQAALDSLYGVLTRPFSASIRRRNFGIEGIVVTEINHLIAKHPNLNISEIDERLIKDVSADIRVVINWDMNNVGINLIVIDPECSCNNCHYNHHTGGLHSGYGNIKSGYGPVYFFMKQAKKGKYQFYANYFHAREFAAAGPVTVMAEIYTNYAGQNEQRKIACLQLSKAKNMRMSRWGVLVAELKH
jgi:hypothetical protein